MPALAAVAMTALALVANPSNGLAWTPPAGWQTADPRLDDLATPSPQLAAATFAVRGTQRDRDCRLDRVHAQVPKGGALVLLLEDREAAARPRALRRLPARPRPFRLPAPVGHECFGVASVVPWTEQGRSFMAVALFGTRVITRTGARARDAERARVATTTFGFARN